MLYPCLQYEDPKGRCARCPTDVHPSLVMHGLRLCLVILTLRNLCQEAHMGVSIAHNEKVRV